MRFQKFSCLNDALFAKQGWQVIQCLNFLLAKVLKARYFLRMGFDKVAMRYQPRYTWRGSMKQGGFWM